MLPEKGYFPLSYYFSDYRIANDSSVNSVSYSLLNSLRIKSREVLSKVIADRIYFLRKNIDEINDSLLKRQKLTITLKSDIDENICKVNTEILQMRFIPDPVKRSNLESRIMELSKEKRNNDLSYWQDTVKLKHEKRKAEKELRTAMLDLWMIRFLS